jgi:hypothetical protein
MRCRRFTTIGQKAQKKIGAGSETRGDGKRNVRGFADVVDVTTGDAG